MDNDDPWIEVVDLGEFMCAKDQCAVLRRATDNATQARTLFGIESDRGFVEQQELRVRDDRTRQGEPTAHTARQRASFGAGMVREFNHSEALLLTQDATLAALQPLGIGNGVTDADVPR
ncbi:MAG: hypothetical protein V9G19_05000 [Tetrasphaera sp.]